MSVDRALQRLVLAAAITAPSLALALPTFTARAGPGNNSSCGDKTVVTAGSLVPASASQVCANFRGTPAQLASIGDVPFALRLDAITGANGSGASARSNFSNTLEFPSGMDVFNLPVGYTVNAGNYLVDNRFADPNIVGAVPEPGTWALLLFGFGVLSFVVRRRNKAS